MYLQRKTHDKLKTGQRANSITSGKTHSLVDGFGRVILSLYSDVRVQLADGPGVLLEHLTVPSGYTENKHTVNDSDKSF